MHALMTAFLAQMLEGINLQKEIVVNAVVNN